MRSQQQQAEQAILLEYLRAIRAPAAQRELLRQIWRLSGFAHAVATVRAWASLPNEVEA